MEMNTEQLSDLLYKYLAGELSAKEREMLNTWLEKDTANQVLFEKMVDAKNIERGTNNQYRIKASSEKVFKKVWQNIESSEHKVTPQASKFKFLRQTWLRYAAAIILTVGVVMYFAVTEKRPTPTINLSSTNKQHEILPASGKATLTLSNGTTMELDPSSKMSISDGSLPIQNNNGALKYSGSGSPVYNTINTPKGGQYRIVFADGTQVWMNSASSLTYPTVFTGEERIVELKGQAYFEVAKNHKQPFRVKANGVEVEVLGTHFDVMAYNDETSVHTTLIEGSVRVHNGSSPVIIQPGQQAVVNNTTQNISVNEADLNSVTAWKNGLFVFNNTSLERILKEIARWYDVEIINHSKNSSELYGGSISREQKLSDVLELLGADGSCQFKIDGRKVFVE